MGIKDYPGGVIRSTPVVPQGPFEDGAAPGVWTLDLVADYVKQGIWPTAGNLPPLAFVYGGSAGGYSNVIDYVNLSTTGNFADFGDATAVPVNPSSSASSATRGVFAIPTPGNYSNSMSYLELSSPGNASDFGDLTYTPAYIGGGCSNSTRGLFAGGYTNPLGVTASINYITIASLGNAISFGSLSVSRNRLHGIASPTLGVFFGGFNEDATRYSTIDSVTIASTGNAVSFGSLVTGNTSNISGCASSTRGIMAGGNTGSAINNIQYITFSSTGNSIDFGDLLQAAQLIFGTSSNTTGIFGYGGESNVVQYITIATTGNSLDFGDLTVARSSAVGASNCHGGL